MNNQKMEAKYGHRQPALSCVYLGHNNMTRKPNNKVTDEIYPNMAIETTSFACRDALNTADWFATLVKSSWTWDFNRDMPLALDKREPHYGNTASTRMPRRGCDFLALFPVCTHSTSLQTISVPMWLTKTRATPDQKP